MENGIILSPSQSCGDPFGIKYGNFPHISQNGKVKIPASREKREKGPSESLN
jgi:hypothetical protein